MPLSFVLKCFPRVSTLILQVEICVFVLTRFLIFLHKSFQTFDRNQKKMSSEKKKSFSFGFSKVQAKNLEKDSVIRDKTTKEVQNEKDFILEVNESEIKGTKKKEMKQELVIPCQGNTYKKPAEKPKNVVKTPSFLDKDENDLTDEEKAAKVLLEESKNWQEMKDNEELPKAHLVIKSNANEIDSHPDVSTQDDYESIPVEGFGMAMLRGMGFKPEEGIGGFRKAKVECIDPIIRPKGLGLGASVPKSKQNNSKSDKKEELILKKGAYVRIQSGKNKGQYGEVEGLDADSARVIVRIHGENVSISENAILLVDKAEYKKCKNVINNDMYEEYNQKQKEHEKIQNEGGALTSNKKSKKPNLTWVQKNLRVRIIDKKSKYFKEKVIVNDVLSNNQIECVTNSGQILDNIDPHDVETVIPKDEMSIVMIVRGSEFNGKVGELLRKDPEREVVEVTLLPDKDEILKFGYDDVCEVTGDITEFF